jgi:hypothetical protein
MEVTNDVVETEIETTTPAEVSADATQASEAQAPEGTAPATETPVAPVDAALAQPATPAYTPDFKVKIKGKEHEIDEMFRGLIKDPETEKKVKEVFEKAYGIEAVKADRTALKSEYEGFKSQVIPHLQVLDQFTTLRDSGNLGAAFQVAGISDEQIFEYAIQKLEMEKNPVLAKTYTAQQAEAQKTLELQRKVAMYEQQTAQTEEQRFNQELEESIGANQALVAQVNAKFGSEDFFRDEVIQYGLMQHNRGKMITPSEATAAVVNKYKQLFPATSAPQAAAPVNPQVAPSTPQRPATMPNVGNSNVSPVAKKVRSMDDLFAAQKEAMQG